MVKVANAAAFATSGTVDLARCRSVAGGCGRVCENVHRVPRGVLWARARGERCGVVRCAAEGESASQGAAEREAKRDKVIAFLKDASTLGTIRFINISQGVVLETLGRFDYNVTPFETPAGKYISVTSPDKLFECHINTDKVSTITISEESSKAGNHKLYVIRLKDAAGGNLLSCLLMWDPSQGMGRYSDTAVKRFEALIARYGTQLVL
mmetsp:Transcript_3060/g.8455  ORF Transcript_3060/g.8455 Transcript_3060/m.8455 type:complete len:209 (-) Transcript_3060:201-827(-)